MVNFTQDEQDWADIFAPVYAIADIVEQDQKRKLDLQLLALSFSTIQESFAFDEAHRNANRASLDALIKAAERQAKRSGETAARCERDVTVAGQAKRDWLYRARVRLDHAKQNATLDADFLQLLRLARAAQIR